MDQKISQYRINQARRFYCNGSQDFCERTTKLLASLDFLVPTPLTQFDAKSTLPYVVVTEVDFDDTAMMQSIAREMETRWTPFGYKILCAKGDTPLHHPYLLFGVEIGAGYTAHGVDKESQMKERIKKWALDSQDGVIYTAILAEIERCYLNHDQEGLRKVGANLNELNRSNEEVLKLQVIYNQKINRPSRVEFFLKEILRQNPQSLWAANQLGRYYIEHQSASLGIEVLEKLSHFHNLNGERLLTLGNAYLNAGMPERAIGALEVGSALNHGGDSRFEQGLQKATLTQCVQSQDDLSLFDGKPLHRDVLSFLNMRAILAIKSGRWEEGYRFYEVALKGAAEEPILGAKLSFNQGLAYVRAGDVGKAKESFKRSTELGGREFTRAARPYAITTSILQRSAAPETFQDELQELSLVEDQWEKVS